MDDEKIMPWFTKEFDTLRHNLLNIFNNIQLSASMIKADSKKDNFNDLMSILESEVSKGIVVLKNTTGEADSSKDNSPSD